MEKIIDLHIHTCCSDGAFTPKQVIDEAVHNNVSVIAIADHDTVDAYSDELFQYATQKGIRVIPAVEISTKTKRCGIHVLGYHIDLKNDEFLKKLSSLRNARHDYLYNVASKLESLGYVINIPELDKIDAVTKAHISLDVVNNPQNRELLMTEFGHIPDKGEFIETVMNEGCPAYVEKVTITPVEAAHLIRSAGGKVVLAHPVAYKYEDNLTDDDILSLATDMNVDGIETNYVYIDRFKNKINEIEHWNDFARQYGFKTSVGSDFHTKDGIYPVIGLIGEDLKNYDINSIMEWLVD